MFIYTLDRHCKFMLEYLCTCVRKCCIILGTLMLRPISAQCRSGWEWMG